MSTTTRTPNGSGARLEPLDPVSSAGESWVSAHLPILAPTLLALALTAWRYDTTPLWRDEMYTLVTAGRSLPDMFGLLPTRDAGLTVYYVLMHGWLLVSQDPAWMRLPSALAAVAAVALTAVLGRRLGGNGVALIAGTIVALSAALVVHAQEARPYPLVLAATLTVALLALRSAQDPRRRRWIALGVVAAVAIGLHPLVALPAVAGILGVLWLHPGRATRREMILLALPAAVLGIPLVLVGSAQAVASPPARMPLWKLTTFWKLFGADLLPGVVVGVLAVVGALVLLRRRRELLLLLSWAVLPLAAVSVLGLLGGYFNSRYGTDAVPPLAILAAIGACAIIARGSAHLRPAIRTLARPLAISVLSLTVVLALAPGAVASHEKAYSFDDALLSLGDERVDTLGGQDVPAGEQQRALADRPRVWVVGTMAVASGDLSRGSSITRAAEAGRTLVSRMDHGHVRVELWATGQG